MIYKIFSNKTLKNVDLYLTTISSGSLKYLWSDCKDEDEDFEKESDKVLIFNSAEEAFDFIEKEKDNFTDSDECFVIVQK
jgi:superfamily II DNA/RNA helicase